MKLFFDLDGTLMDPGVGITRCLQHALAGLGRPVPPVESLRRFVGPPLRETFAELLESQDKSQLERIPSVKGGGMGVRHGGQACEP